MESYKNFQNNEEFRRELDRLDRASSGTYIGDSQYGPISEWNVSNITDMSYVFYNKDKFNQPLNWTVSSVRDMSYMFAGAKKF